MSETYELELTNGLLIFVNDSKNMPAWALEPKFDPTKAEAGVILECRMGDPALLHCAVFRKKGQPGGIFSVYNGKEPLFAAHAASNLLFAAGMGYFGELTANARYGVDVFENMELNDE